MTVAADPVVPGTPNRTVGIVSEVVVTEPIPRRKAKADEASIFKVKGSRRAIPTTPPSPGMIPIPSPIMTPDARITRRAGSSIAARDVSRMSKVSGPMKKSVQHTG
jgi:hypothetical protein